MQDSKEKGNGKAFLITHGDRDLGENPSHTVPGIIQIANLKIPDNVGLVVVGTGLRFQQIFNVIQKKIGDATIIYSPFCGSVDGLEKDGSIILIDGTIVAYDNYQSLIRSKAFNAWAFIEELIELANGTNVILCAGGELMIALGLEEKNEKGHIFELDPKTKDGHMIQ